MNIGLDIDNVISAFDIAIWHAFVEEDKHKRGKGVVNKNAEHIIRMFDWSPEEVGKFFADNMEAISKTLRLRRNCRKYMDKLLEEGHKLYLITHRAYPDYKHPEKTTLDWLKKRNIHYTKLVLSESPDKTKECKAYDIDIMVDDRVEQCKKMIDGGVNCFLMQTKYNKNRMEGLPYVKNWKDLYELILRCGKKI